MSDDCSQQRQVDCAREFGQIGARLSTIDGEISVLFRKLDQQTNSLTDMRLESAEHMGELKASLIGLKQMILNRRNLWKSVIAAVSATAGALTAWLVKE